MRANSASGTVSASTRSPSSMRPPPAPVCASAVKGARKRWMVSVETAGHRPGDRHGFQCAEHDPGFFVGFARRAGWWIVPVEAAGRRLQGGGQPGGEQGRRPHLAYQERYAPHGIVGQHRDRDAMVLDLALDLAEAFHGEPDHEEATPSLVDHPNAEDAREGRGRVFRRRGDGHRARLAEWSPRGSKGTSPARRPPSGHRRPSRKCRSAASARRPARR